MSSIGRIATITRSRVGGVILAVLLGLVVLASAQQVQAQEVPTIPNLAISDITETTALVTVEATAGCTVEDIVLDYREGTSGPYTDIASGVCSDLIGNEYELTGLTANTGYNVRVSASLADSTTTTEVITPFTTAPIAQSAISSVVVTNITQTTATATINAQNTSNRIFYRYRTTGVGTWAGQSLGTGHFVRTVNLTGLTQGTGYEVEATTGSSSSGLGNPNAGVWATATFVVSATFTTTVTTSPTSVSVSSVTDTTATFVATVTGNTYILWWRYRTTGAGGWAGGSQSITSTSTTITISGLTQVTAYELEVFHIGPGVTFSPTSNNWSNQHVARTSFTTAETNVAPTASASASPTTVNPGGTVALTGVASDGNSADTLTYSWASSNGGNFSSTTALSPTWTPPIFTSDTDVILTLTVNDGTVSTNATVTVTVAATTLPHAPTALTLVASFTEIGTSWTAPVDTGTSSLSGYYLQYRVKGAPSWTSIDLSTTGTSHLIPSLNSGTTYQAQVAAKTSAGTGPYSSIEEATTGIAEGPWSDEVTATTTVSSLGQVTGLSVSASSAKTLAADWTDMAAATSYKVQWREVAGAAFGISNQEIVTSSEYVIPNLKAGTAYSVRVAAKKEGIVDGPWSAASPATTLVLDKVASVTTAPSYSFISVQWGSVADAASYEVQWRTTLEAFDATRELTRTAPTVTAVIGSLLEGTDYYIRIRAIPTGGVNGVWSDEASTTTTLEPPGRVTDLALTVVSGTQIGASWTAVSTADAYLVQWAGTSAELGTLTGSEATATDVSHDITSLLAGTPYYVRVAAQRAGAEDGAFSLPMNATTLLAAPGAISGLHTAASTATTLTADWNDATNATGYIIQWRTTSGAFGTSNQAIPTASTYKIIGLTASTTYYYRVKPTRTGGDDGGWSSEASIHSDVAPLTQATGLAGSATSSTQIAVSWDLLGGAEAYVVQWQAPGAGYSISNQATPTAATHDITGLTASTTYTFRVRGTQTLGDDGPWSEDATAKTLLAPPGNISGLTDTSITPNSIVIDWADATNATSYIVQWSASSGVFSSSKQDEVMSSTYEIVSLLPSTHYYFRVRAHRTGGDDGAWSGQDDATTTSGVLGQVTGLTATAASDTSIRVSWTRATDALGYEVDWRRGDYGGWTTNTISNGATVAITISGLSPGAHYQARVRATRTNAADGTYSTTQSGATTGTPITCVAAHVRALGELVPGIALAYTLTDLSRNCVDFTYTSSETTIFSFTVGLSTDVEIGLTTLTLNPDPTLVIYQNAFGNSTVEIYDLDSGTGNNAELTLAAEPSTTYYISAATHTASTGQMKLTIMAQDVVGAYARLFSTGGFTDWQAMTSADGRRYESSLPDANTFVLDSRVEIAVRSDLTVDAPLDVLVIRSSNNSPLNLTMAQRGRATIANNSYATYRSTANVTQSIYVGGTVQAALTGNLTQRLLFDPSPEAGKWRSTIPTVRNFSVQNVDGTARITVSAGLRISRSSAWVPDCLSSNNRVVTLTADTTVYIAPCISGQQTISLDDLDDDDLDSTYTLIVLSVPVVSPSLPSSLAADTQVHGFAHTDPYTLNIEADHVTSGARLVVGLDRTIGSSCTSGTITSPNDVDVAPGASFYVAACTTGDATLTLSDGADELVEYEITLVLPSSQDNLQPSPADAAFGGGDGVWHTFTNQSGLVVTVSTHADNGDRIVISSSNAQAPSCPSQAGASVPVLHRRDHLHRRLCGWRYCLGCSHCDWSAVGADESACGRVRLHTPGPRERGHPH